MKITSSRKNDILRRQREYEENKKIRQEQYDAQLRSFMQAEEETTEPVAQYLRDLFSKYPLLEADIRVSPGRYGSQGLQVNISVNEHSKFEDNTALAWSYEASITRDGEVQRETSSWSGMSAVTSAQINQLEQSVQVLKQLANLDWENLLNRTLPKYSDYITVDNPRYDRNVPNFKQELIEAELEDIIGERKVIEVKPFSSSWYNNGSYVAILRDTGKQYVIKEWSKWDKDHGDISKTFDTRDSRRVQKSSIVPVSPINIIEV